MDSFKPDLKLSKFVLFVSCLLIGLVLPDTISAYNIGVGIADVTGPVAEINFMGYANPKQKGSGIHLRLFARSFIIQDDKQRFVFVSVDSGMIGYGIKNAVIEKLQSKFGDLYTESNVMISGTHTHSGPGGYMMNVLYDISILGFVKQTFMAYVDGITKSIIRAHKKIVPGKILINSGEVLDANINRSPHAYENNPKTEKDKYKYNVDKDLVQMQFIRDNGVPLGVINWFAVHPTSMNNTNTLVSSDNVGYASVLFEKKLNNFGIVGKGDFVAAFASTNLGDVSPNTQGPKCEFSGNACSEEYKCPKREGRCFASGPGKDMFDSTSIIAHKIFEEAWRLWNDGKGVEIKGPLRVVHRFVDMPNQKVNYFNESIGETQLVGGCLPAMGYSFAAGTIDGPGSFAFEQGTTSSNPFWNFLVKFLTKATNEDVRCHYPKPILLPTGRVSMPYEWQPKIVSTQLALVGNVVLAGVPGEFSTMSGRRLRENIEKAIAEVDESFGDVKVIVAGLCNTYTSYITTPEEYQIQRYEGASTIFGPHTLTIYLKQYSELAKHAVLEQSVESGPTPPDLSKKPLMSLVTPVIVDNTKIFKKFGQCIQQPMKSYKPDDVVTVKFISGHPRNNHMAESTYLTVEKMENDAWIAVATDADWETKFIWRRTNSIMGYSEVIIKWEIPDTVDEGIYRIRHNGHHRTIYQEKIPYEGISNKFKVIPNNFVE